MFFKTAAAACSLAALLMIGCNTDDNDLDDGDTIVTPDDDYSPDTTPVTPDPVTPDPGTTTGDDLDPAAPPAFPGDSEPAPDAGLPEVDAPDADEPDVDEPVVEEVESDALPDEDEEE